MHNILCNSKEVYIGNNKDIKYNISPSITGYFSPFIKDISAMGGICFSTVCPSATVIVGLGTFGLLVIVGIVVSLLQVGLLVASFITFPMLTPLCIPVFPAVGAAIGALCAAPFPDSIISIACITAAGGLITVIIEGLIYFGSKISQTILSWLSA